ncbi:hypothetical protein M8818_007445 [Zalaria obscura]|uniref:Uncharacterized protein n=1 Tax=Zalaria obscura TaxID=2024903 RepID=A0ACC3S523_9PEZI
MSETRILAGRVSRSTPGSVRSHEWNDLLKCRKEEIPESTARFLAQGLGQSGKDTGLVGTLHLTTANNQVNLTRDDIAFISCDPSSYGGFISMSDVIQSAESANTTAILLYSTTASYCNLTSSDQAYPFVYSTMSADDAWTLLNQISGSGSSEGLWATIGRADDLANSTSNDNSSTTTISSSTSSSSNTPSSSPSGDSSSSEPLGPSPSTAVAMIILYSITGIITGLFLVIIITGAVRAHRHPERYGPRNILGRPRQSRARGLARAMLETLPIVKFGDHTEAAKPTDVELANTENADRNTVAAEVTESNPDASKGEPATSENPDREIESSGEAAQTVASSAAAAAPVTQGEDALGCSICTDDFEPGQDLRVLPCDHKFHPACIDPWLLNVSGTCPLCRIDLRPTTTNDSQESGAGEAEGELPPPLEDQEGRRGSIVGSSVGGFRRSILGGISQLARIGEVSADDRVSAMRRYHAARVAEEQTYPSVTSTGQGVGADASAAGAVTESAQEERTRRRRWRERFGIRTRRRGADGVETTAPDAVAGQSAQSAEQIPSTSLPAVDAPEVQRNEVLSDNSRSDQS